MSNTLQNVSSLDTIDLSKSYIFSKSLTERSTSNVEFESIDLSKSYIFSQHTVDFLSEAKPLKASCDEELDLTDWEMMDDSIGNTSSRTLEERAIVVAPQVEGAVSPYTMARGWELIQLFGTTCLNAGTQAAGAAVDHWNSMSTAQKVLLGINVAVVVGGFVTGGSTVIMPTAFQKLFEVVGMGMGKVEWINRYVDRNVIKPTKATAFDLAAEGLGMGVEYGCNFFLNAYCAHLVGRGTAGALKAARTVGAFAYNNVVCPGEDLIKDEILQPIVMKVLSEAGYAMGNHQVVADATALLLMAGVNYALIKTGAFQTNAAIEPIATTEQTDISDTNDWPTDLQGSMLLENDLLSEITDLNASFCL